MKVAILYICTGKYNQFFEGFFESAERYFLKGIAQLEYFVFTDDMQLSDNERVHLFERKCQGFPLDSLFRFDMFLSIADKLKDFDYCFFFNANMLFVQPVGEEFLPKEEGLAAVLHPGYYNRPACFFPYERNKKCHAYIAPYGKDYHYYMGSLNGGRTEDYLRLAKACSEAIHQDYDRGIIARYHDESQLNRYMRDHRCKSLSPVYACPEGDGLLLKSVIVIRDKVKVDPYFSKVKTDTLSRVRNWCKTLWNAIRWYLYI